MSTMNLSVRTGIFAGMAGLTLACCLLFSTPPTNPEAGVVVWLPKDIPGHVGERSEMGKLESEWLPPDTTYLRTTYRERWRSKPEADYRALNATLIVAGSDSRSLHRPRVCLTAQGWAITKEEIVRLETTAGPLEVMDYSLSRYVRNEDGSPRLDDAGKKMILRAHYVYWWVGPSGSTPSDEARVWTSVWNSILRGENERWAYPSVMTWIDERIGEDAEQEARDRIFEFIMQYAPQFQKSLGAKDREDALPLNTL